MSGSSVIQDGKLVGVVTYALVNDPIRGYCIFIENMLDAAGQKSIIMDFDNVPVGFGMALSMNPGTLNAYSPMTEKEKQAVLDRAHHAAKDKFIRM